MSLEYATSETMATIVMDIQGFKIGTNSFYPKEFAVYDGNAASHYIFRPPFPFKMLPEELQRQAKWLMHNHHCIDWEEGFTPAYLLPKIIQRLTRDVDIVYVKGKEKAAYLKKYTNKITELNEHPALRASTPSCLYHTDPLCICALSNVYNLYQEFIMHE